MPCFKCKNGKWRFGNGDCNFNTEEDCRKVERAYYAKKGDKSGKRK